MELDKKWMQIIDRTDPLYEKGVFDFIEFAFNGFEEGKLLRFHEIGMICQWNLQMRCVKKMKTLAQSH